jgi:hypothetical protein
MEKLFRWTVIAVGMPVVFPVAFIVLLAGQLLKWRPNFKKLYVVLVRLLPRKGNKFEERRNVLLKSVERLSEQKERLSHELKKLEEKYANRLACLREELAEKKNEVDEQRHNMEEDTKKFRDKTRATIEKEIEEEKKRRYETLAEQVEEQRHVVGEKLRIEKEAALKRLIEWEQGEEARLTKLLDEEYNAQRKELQKEIEKKVQEELCRIQKLFQDLGDEKTRLVKTNIQEFLKSEFQRLH